MYGVLRLAVECADSVTCLVECRKALFFLAYNLRLLFWACNYLDGSFLYIRLSDSLSVVSCRKQSRLVYKVRKVCACKSCRTLCYCSKANIGSELFILCMNTQDSLSALDIGVAYCNLSVKTSGTEQCRVCLLYTSQTPSPWEGAILQGLPPLNPCLLYTSRCV